jgi:hypothetical protein
MPNVAVPAPPDALFKLKFHQLAIYHHNPEAAVRFWMDAGYTEWVQDDCLLLGKEYDVSITMREREFFNYDILPLELCYMQYSTGQFSTQDDRSGNPPFLAHMAAYVENLEEQMMRIKATLNLHPYRIYDSVEHQNPYLVKRGITFHKAIYDTTHWLGYDVKLTQKVFASV